MAMDSYYFDKLTAEEIHPYIQRYVLKHIDLYDQPLNKDNKRLIKARCAMCGYEDYFLVAHMRDLCIDDRHYNPKNDAFIMLCYICNSRTWNDSKRTEKYGVPPSIQE